MSGIQTLKGYLLGSNEDSTDLGAEMVAFGAGNRFDEAAVLYFEEEAAIPQWAAFNLVVFVRKDEVFEETVVFLSFLRRSLEELLEILERNHLLLKF